MPEDRQVEHERDDHVAISAVRVRRHRRDPLQPAAGQRDCSPHERRNSPTFTRELAGQPLTPVGDVVAGGQGVGVAGAVHWQPVVEDLFEGGDT
jgi:hypothetical protein